MMSQLMHLRVELLKAKREINALKKRLATAEDLIIRARAKLPSGLMKDTLNHYVEEYR